MESSWLNWGSFDLAARKVIPYGSNAAKWTFLKSTFVRKGRQGPNWSRIGSPKTSGCSWRAQYLGRALGRRRGKRLKGWIRNQDGFMVGWVSHIWKQENIYIVFLSGHTACSAVFGGPIYQLDWWRDLQNHLCYWNQLWFYLNVWG